MSRIAFCFFLSAALHVVLAIFVAMPVMIMASQTGDIATSMSIVAQR